MKEAEALCVKEVEQVSQIWEVLIDDEEIEKVKEQLHTAETKVNQLNIEMKELSLVEKMAKSIEMKRLQKQVTTL